MNYSAMASALGLPGLTVPVGHHEGADPPLSVQLIGAEGSEPLLLALARQFADALPPPDLQHLLTTRRPHERSSPTAPFVPSKDPHEHPDRHRPAGDHRGGQAFLSVWLPSVLAVVGTGACLFTVSWWLSTTEQGGAALGTVVGLSALVSLTTNVVFSGSVDRGNRQVLAAGLIGAGLVPVTLAAVLLHLDRTSPALLILAGVCYTLISSLETLYLGTCETTAADLAPSTWPLTRIALLTQIHSQVDRIIVPVFAGLLIGRDLAPAVPVVAAVLLLLVDASTFAARRHYANVTRVRSGPDGESGSALVRLFTDARAAAGLVRRSGPLSYMVVFGMLGNLVVFPFYAILPAFLLDYVPAGPESGTWAGRAAAAYGIGMLVVGAVLLRSGRSMSGSTGISAATLALAGICLVITAVTFAPSPHWVVAALGVTGGLFSILTAVGGAIWLEQTPPTVRARVFSFRRLTVFSTIPLGTLVMGAGGAAFGYALFTRWMALVTLAGLAVAWAWYERRRRADLTGAIDPDNPDNPENLDDVEGAR